MGEFFPLLFSVPLLHSGLKDPSCFDEMDPLDPDALRTPEIIQSYVSPAVIKLMKTVLFINP